MTPIRPLLPDDLDAVTALYEAVARSGSRTPAPGVREQFERTRARQPAGRRGDAVAGLRRSGGRDRGIPRLPSAAIDLRGAHAADGLQRPAGGRPRRLPRRGRAAAAQVHVRAAGPDDHRRRHRDRARDVDQPRRQGVVAGLHGLDARARARGVRAGAGRAPRANGARRPGAAGRRRREPARGCAAGAHQRHHHRPPHTRGPDRRALRAPARVPAAPRVRRGVPGLAARRGGRRDRARCAALPARAPRRSHPRLVRGLPARRAASPRCSRWAAAPRHAGAVLDRLFTDCAEAGCAAVQGRLEPAPAGGDQGAAVPGAAHRVGARGVRRTPRVLAAIAYGDALLTRLDGEWWMGHHL